MSLTPGVAIWTLNAVLSSEKDWMNDWEELPEWQGIAIRNYVTRYSIALTVIAIASHTFFSTAQDYQTVLAICIH